jgi:hypothetical protein
VDPKNFEIVSKEGAGSHKHRLRPRRQFWGSLGLRWMARFGVPPGAILSEPPGAQSLRRVS